MDNIGLPGVLLILYAIVVVVVPYKMAQLRHRDGLLWVLIGIVASPVLAILLLLALGDAESKEGA